MARLRSNTGKFIKQATIEITKQLQNVAEKERRNVSKIVAEKLEQTYKENVLASYTPRTTRGQEIKIYNESAAKAEEEYNKGKQEKKRFKRKKQTYHHTGIFLDSIYTKIDGSKIKVMVRNQTYPDGASTIDVYKWLTKGTKGSDKPYPYIKTKGGDKTDPKNYKQGWSWNYPTPKHEFEKHTMLQMIGFMSTLASDIENRKYKSRKYYKKKK